MGLAIANGGKRVSFFIIVIIVMCLGTMAFVVVLLYCISHFAFWIFQIGCGRFHAWASFSPLYLYLFLVIRIVVVMPFGLLATVCLH